MPEAPQSSPANTDPTSGDTPRDQADNALGQDSISPETLQMALMLEQLMRRAGRTAISGEPTDDDIDQVVQQQPEIDRSPEEWAHERYGKLANSWGRLGIAIPTEQELAYKLQAAADVINRLSAAEMHLQHKMGVVLVPPTDVIGWPVKTELRERQAANGELAIGQAGVDIREKRRMAFRKGDVSDHAGHVHAPAPSNEWRVLVTDVSEDGTHFGSPHAILKSESYMIDGFDTRGMGPAEYAALSLQVAIPDQKNTGKTIPVNGKTKTLLMKGIDSTNETHVGVAGHHVSIKNKTVGKPSSQHFEFEEIGAAKTRGQMRYRPTVEITSDMAMDAYNAALDRHTQATGQVVPRTVQPLGPNATAF